MFYKHVKNYMPSKSKIFFGDFFLQNKNLHLSHPLSIFVKTNIVNP